MLLKTLGNVSARSAVARTSRLVKGSRFLRRIPTTSLAVQAHRPISTSSTGLEADFSPPVSTTSACPLLAWPRKRSWSVHSAFASIMEPRFSLFALCFSLWNCEFSERMAKSKYRISLVLLVNRVLVLWPLQADGDNLLRLIDGVVVPEGLKPWGDHLHAQQAIGNPVALGLTLGVRL